MPVGYDTVPILSIMHPSPTSDPLHCRLQDWRVAPPVEPGFRPAVRERIAARLRRGQETWGAYCRRHAVLWSLVFATVVTGAAVHGQRVGERHSEADHRAMVGTYLAEIDARAMEH